MNVCKSLNFKFAHHHTHTEYSPMDAPVGLKKLIEYSKQLGYKTVTVTDHGTVSSWVKLATYCKEADIKPIFGLEGYFTPNRHLHSGGRNSYHCVLIAKNNQGVKNIMRISDLSYREGYYFDPRFDWELLEKYHDGIICTSSCVSGIVPDTLRLREQLASTDSQIVDKAKLELENRYKEFYNEEELGQMMEQDEDGGSLFEPSPEDLAMTFAKRFKKIFGQDFYAEVQYHGIDVETSPYSGVIKIAKELDLKVVGTNDVHYLRKEDANTQEVMMAINTGKCIKDSKRLRHDTNQFYLKSPEEMLEALGGRNSAAVQGALEIADVCTAELNKKTQLPSVAIPKEYKTDIEYLEALARDGLRRIGKENNPVYEARFKEEMDVIKRLREKGKQFDRYFLVVWDYVNWAWNNGIRVGVGRGSGAGSLILYCLRITGIDPIPYDLLFERFLAEDRNEMPDIDIDFDHEGGERVYAYVCQKYGVERCARIGTFLEFHVASAIKAAFRVFDPGNTYEKELAEKQEAEQLKKIAGKKGIQVGDKKVFDRDETAALANEITKMLPKDPNSGAPTNKCTLLKEKWQKLTNNGQNPEECIYVYDACPEFRDYKRRYPEIFTMAEAIEGLKNNRGIHAAGVLITEDELVNVCPQQFSGRSKQLATAFDMNDIEKIGGVKFDFLRTKVLSVLSRAIKTIADRYGKIVDIDNLPTNDAAALKIFEKGDTTGIFQFESDGMREMLKSMGGVTFEDVVAANALYRPGPMENIPAYCKRKRGEEPVSYEAKALEPILKPTLGIIVYQEQVMKTVRVLAGFTGPEADTVRKAMGKKKKDILDKMKEKFINGCETLKTCPPAVAQNLWAQMEKFGAYAFNKSHSAGYSYTAYQCAYLKAHYPEEFMAAQITVEAGDSSYDTTHEYERALRDMKIKLLEIDVNESKADYIVVDVGAKKAIRKGFKGILGLGEKAHLDIVASQPFKDMFDYCMKAGVGANSGVVTALLDGGGFDCFLPKLSKKLNKTATRVDLMADYNDKIERAKIEKKFAEKNKGMVALFGADDDDEDNAKKGAELTL